MYDGGVRREGPDGDVTTTRSVVGEPDPQTTHTGVQKPPGDAPAFLERPSTIGRYVIVDQLGMGGMGVVFKAYDPELDRGVALKLIRVRADRTTSLEPSKRLLREAKALARLSHPNVVAVYDAGEYDGQVYVAMELVEGHDVKQWLALAERSVTDIVSVFADAGRGLAAAHAAGIVHRDFKPANVMVGDDGRARVLDFGLARAASADEIDPYDLMPGSESDTDEDTTHDALPKSPTPTSGRSPTFEAKLTEVGHVLGTPAYMAPEQATGRTADELSDQFSFCVSMYVALYGERPYPGKTRAELVKSVAEGKLRSAPGDTGVPARLRKVVARGLSADPAGRYPSMNALLADLVTDPALRRNRLLAIVLAVALVAALVVAALARRGGDEVCTGAEAQLAGVWDDAVAADVKAAFEASELSARYVAATYEQTSRVLGAYAGAWTDMRTAACEDTRIRGTQSENLLDLRMQCLDRHLDKLRALTALLADREAAPVADAVKAALSLPSLSACADSEALLAAIPPPSDDDTRRAVAEIRERLDEAEVLYNSGDYARGLAVATALAESATAIDYPPLRAEVGLVRARLEDASGARKQARASLEDVILTGSAARTDRLVAEAWIELIGVVGYDEVKVRDAFAMRIPARAAIARAGADSQLESDMLHTLALIEWRAGDFEAAQTHHERALEIRLAADPPDRVRVADSLNSIAMVLSSRGRYADAQRFHERALDERIAIYGQDHPVVGDSLDNLGVQLYHQGAYDEALPYYQRALEIRVLALGPDHLNVGTSHNNIGSLFLDKGNYDLAVEEYEQALAIWEPILGVDHPDIGLILSNLGDVANRRGDYARALEVCERALAIEAPSLGEEHPDLAYNLTCSGEALLGLGRARQSLGPLSRALTLRENNDVNLAERGRTRFAVARALWATGGDRARSRKLATTAREDFAAAGAHTAAEQAAIDEWLANPD